MTSAPTSPQANPFPGLRPFRENEAHLFFGRENQVDAMVDKLAATHFLATIGSSGSGKSSLVNCGLRPALRQGLMARAGTAWRMAQCRPGNDPIGSMARALAQDGVLFEASEQSGLSMAEIVETTLRMSKLGLIDICEQAALEENVNVLVVVDQFEELFRYRQLTGADTLAEDAAAFVNLLVEVKAHPASQIYVVLTMRSDFLGDCTQYPGLPETINAGQYLVPRLTRDERRAAIEGPVGVGGAQISPVLLTRLVNDVGDNPDQLSILQHALNRTWALWREHTRGKGPIDLAHYNAIGTMDHALDQHADLAYGELDPHHQAIAEKLFKALTDKANDHRGVRRPTTLKTLCALTDATEVEDVEVINAFRDPSRSFLMPPAGEPLNSSTVIDISHESLMRVWQRLIKWTDDEAQSARIYRRLAETAELHATGGANLLRDPELQLALDWCAKNKPNEAWASRYHPGFATAMEFLSHSKVSRDTERAERRAQRQRLLKAEQEKAAAQAREAKRMRLAAIICFGLFMLSVVAGGIAFYAYQMAEEASQMAEIKENEAREYLKDTQITQSRWLIKAADRMRDSSLKVLLALEALPHPDEGVDRPLYSKAQESLRAWLDDLREQAIARGHTGAVTSVAATPDGSRIVTGSTDNSVRLWDWKGREVHRFEGHSGPVTGVAITADGKRIASSSSDRTVRLWDVETGAVVREFKGHTLAVNGVGMTPDGTRIVSGSRDRTVRMWDARTGEVQEFKGHASVVNSVAITPDGSKVVSGANDNTVRLWDANGTELNKFSHGGGVTSVAISPDGRRIVSGSLDKTARLWDAQSGSELRKAEIAEAVEAVAITPDGRRFVTGSSDKSIRLWDEKSKMRLLRLDGHDDDVRGVAMLLDGSRIVSASKDGTMRVWDGRRADLMQVKGEGRAIASVAVTPDGTRVITGSLEGQVQLWDATTGDKLESMNGHFGIVRSVVVMPDGTRMVTGSDDRTARLWDMSTGKELIQFKGHTAGVNSVAVLPEGNRIVTGSADKTARVWDHATGDQLVGLKGHTGAVTSVAVMPDGRVLTASVDGTARLWNANTGDQVLRFDIPAAAAVRGVAIMPDGKRIVTASSDKIARLWDTESGAMLLEFKSNAADLRAVAVTSDGRRIVTCSADGTVRLWDVGTGIEIGYAKIAVSEPEAGAEPLAVVPVNGVAIMPDGKRFVTASSDAIWRLWEIGLLRPPPVGDRFSGPNASSELLNHAKTAVQRCLTIDQRVEYSLALKPPAWCIEAAKHPYDTSQWRAWKSGDFANAINSETATKYGNSADQLLKSGDFRIALEAADLGLQFDPQMTWIIINRAHALMYLGDKKGAIDGYKQHMGKEVEQGKWEEVVVADFDSLRANGRDHPLMLEIEQLFKVAPRSPQPLVDVPRR